MKEEDHTTSIKRGSDFFHYLFHQLGTQELGTGNRERKQEEKSKWGAKCDTNKELKETADRANPAEESHERKKVK